MTLHCCGLTVPSVRVTHPAFITIATLLVISQASGDKPGKGSYDYGMVFASSRSQGIDFWGKLAAILDNATVPSQLVANYYAADLPGYTRSSYEADHALITPESRVFASMPGW